jgi:hypothetical protein
MRVASANIAIPTDTNTHLLAKCSGNLFSGSCPTRCDTLWQLTDISDALDLDITPGPFASNDLRKAGSTILPARSIDDNEKAVHDDKLNVFDRSPYKERSVENHEFERRVGKYLINDRALCFIARRIREITGSPMTLAELDDDQQQKLAKESRNIGGAKELLKDADNLDAHVLATLLKAESKQYNFCSPAENTPGVDYLGLDVPERRRCMFNYVESPENIIHPWNSHRFDLGIYEIESEIQLPDRLKNLIADRWDALLGKQADADAYIRDTLALRSFSAKDGIFDILQSVSTQEKKKILIDVLHIPWSTEETIDDENNHRKSNPLGEVYRQHTTGARSNVVRFSDKDDKNVNKWVTEAIVNNKPVVSGPSGHTLRYLSHYAMCKELLRLSGTDVSAFPSLAEARLVMIANLMAPKNHHSYHEIMLASVGIFDGYDEILGYENKADYSDIETTDIGRKALAEARKGAAVVG